MGDSVTRLRLIVGSLLAVAMMVAPTVADAQSRLPNSEQPIDNTARVMDGYVYAIDRLGDTVVVGGDFHTVRDYAPGSPDQTRNYLFSFDLSTGEVSPFFVPDMDDVVHAVHILDDQHVLVAGEFKDINGIRQRGVAKLSLADGSIDSSFFGQTSSAVLDMAVSGDVIYVGGRFEWAGNQRRPKLAALEIDTGRGISAFDFAVTGIVNPTAQDVQSTQVIELDVSDDGRWLSVLGNQSQINGQPRGQLALIDLNDYTLADWSVPQFDQWPCSTGGNKLTYVLTAEFSPDSSYLVTGSMGAYRTPESDALCDTVARFELPPVATGAVRPTWADYTGGDSIFRVQVTDAAVYAGGHQRWANNPYPTTANGTRRGDRDGVGTVLRGGLVALDPVSGVPLSWNPNDDGTRPQRGFEEIIADGDLLLLGSDSTVIGGEIRQRVAAYSTAGGPVNPAPVRATLPVDLLAVHDNGTLTQASFDGTQVGAATPVSGPGIDGTSWSIVGDGFLQHSQLTYFGIDDAYYRRALVQGAWQADTNLSATVGYIDADADFTPYDQPYNVDITVAAGFLDGRIIYTRAGDTRLWWRWYSLESGIIGTQEFEVDTAVSWGSVDAMTIIDGTVYYVVDSSLRSAALIADHTGVAVDDATHTTVDTGSDWADVRGLFTILGSDAVAPTVTVTDPASDNDAVAVDTVLAGTASDDRALSGVSVSVVDGAGQYLQADGTLTGTPYTFDLTVSGQDDVWSLPVSLPLGDGYTVTATATDAGGNDSTPVDRSFDVVTGEPDSVVTDPVNRSTIDEGTVILTGTAEARLSGVAEVGVTVRDRATGDWLQSDGTFAAPFDRVTAQLDELGAPTVTWQLPVNLGPGEWSVTTRAISTDGAVESSTSFMRFTTAVVSNDSTPGVTVIEAPEANSSVAGGTVSVSGVATDDSSGVERTSVAIRNTDTGQWLRRDGTFGNFQWIHATLDSPGAVSTPWQLDVELPAAGNWWIEGRTVDVAGNVEIDRSGFLFQTD